MNDNVVNLRADERVEINLDIGQVPMGHPYHGQYVITLQIAPFRHLDEARQVEKAVREAVYSRLGIAMRKQQP